MDELSKICRPAPPSFWLDMESVEKFSDTSSILILCTSGETATPLHVLLMSVLCILITGPPTHTVEGPD